ncbi:MAG: glycosyltransferase, partial [Gammaproteobacteria bacterium]|nr:glycosyltransferase [Gammaproteobacteria bacterium]
SRAASRGDQIENATFAERAGYSRVLEEAVLDADRLVRAVSEMLSQKVEWTQKVARFEALPSVDLLVDALYKVCETNR